MMKIYIGILAVLMMLIATMVQAEDYLITIQKNHFTPQELTIPAGKKVKITVTNRDSTPAEFESSDLNREKLVGANSDIIVYIGPLDPGRYVFFDDFHRDTTTGIILVK